MPSVVRAYMIIDIHGDHRVPTWSRLLEPFDRDLATATRARRCLEPAIFAAGAIHTECGEPGKTAQARHMHGRDGYHHDAVRVRRPCGGSGAGRRAAGTVFEVRPCWAR